MSTFMSNNTGAKEQYNLTTSGGWQRLGKAIWKYRYIYLMMLPVLALLILFRYVPIYGVQLAFKTYKLAGIAASPWVGLKHFQAMMLEPEFFEALKNTLVISLYKTLFGFPAPILLSLLLNEIKPKRLRKTLQTVYTFPHFLSWVVLAGLMLNLLGDSGVVKKVITVFNPGAAASWNVLYSKESFRSILILSDIWKESGWGTILYLAAITGIDQSLYEAATIDGCNRVQRILHVTLPGISGIIIMMFILQMGGLMNANFDQVFNLYSPPVYSVGDVLDTYIYRMSFQSSRSIDFGFTTAVNLFKNGVNFILIILANLVARKCGSDGIM